MSTFSATLQNIENAVFRHSSITRTKPYKPLLLTRRFLTSTPSRQRSPHTCSSSPSSHTGSRLHTAIPASSRPNYRLHSDLFSADLTTSNMPSTHSEILQQLPTRFDKALEAGDLLFFPSTSHKHEAYGVEVCKSSFSCRSQESWLIVSRSLRFAYVLPCRTSPRYRPLVSMRTRMDREPSLSKRVNDTTRLHLRMSRTCCWAT